MAREAGQRHLPHGLVQRVLVEPGFGADWRDILIVRFVVADDARDRLEGDVLVATLVEVSRALQGIGEDRSARIRYMTEADLADDGDPES